MQAEGQDQTLAQIKNNSFQEAVIDTAEANQRVFAFTNDSKMSTIPRRVLHCRIGMLDSSRQFHPGCVFFSP